MGNLPPNPMIPWRFGNPKVLQQDLQDAGFTDITCTPFSHPMLFSWSDLVKFLLVPNGQMKPMLSGLKAKGRENIDQEAEEVCQHVCWPPLAAFWHVSTSSRMQLQCANCSAFNTGVACVRCHAKASVLDGALKMPVHIVCQNTGDVSAVHLQHRCSLVMLLVLWAALHGLVHACECMYHEHGTLP